MSLLKKKSPPLLGIDISSTAVKLLELKKTDKRYRVESYAVEPLPATAVVEKTIADVVAVSDSIQRAVKRSGTKAKHAAVAVPGSASISKIISMPAETNDAEMAASIEIQADQYVPYPLDEVALDYEVLGPTEGNPENVDVLLVACRSENVEIRKDALEDAGLIAKVVDVESYAMENAFSLIAEQLPRQGEGLTVAVVDIGATVTTVNIMHDNNIVYTREQVFGGRQLTEEIMRRYGLSYEEAGIAKRQGGLPDNYEAEVLEPFKETVVQQVVRSLQFFFANNHHAQVDHIVLAGGSASIPGIDELIESTPSIGAETSIANPFANMSLSSRVKPQVLGADAPSLMVACGLAMRAFD